MHTVLCFCSQSCISSGVLIPSPLRDHSTFISVQGYPAVVQLLEYSLPGRNSINLSWWKSCFWSGTWAWFTRSFSCRLGEWHLPAGVRAFTFPFFCPERTQGIVSDDLSSWLAVCFLPAKYYPKDSKQNQLTSSKVRAEDLEIALFFCRHWLDNGTSSFFSPFWGLMPLELWQIFNTGCGTSWTLLPPPPQDFLVMDASPLLITTSANRPPDTFPANSLSSTQVLPCLDSSMALLSFGFFFFSQGL